MKNGSLEKQLKDLLGSSWNILPKEAKDKLLKKYEHDFYGETKGIGGVISSIRNQRLIQGTLIMGVILGLLGSLFANAIDRIYVPRWGHYYDAGVIALFIGFIFFLLHVFNRSIRRTIESNEHLDTLITELKYSTEKENKLD